MAALNTTPSLSNVASDTTSLVASLSTVSGNVSTILASAGGFRLARRAYSFAVDGGTQTAKPMFTVTGTVILQVFGVCRTTMTGALATVELGISGNTAALIAQTLATLITANLQWKDATPIVNASPIDLTGRSFVVANSATINLLIATANVTAGIIDFYCLWAPLSSGSALAAA